MSRSWEPMLSAFLSPMDQRWHPSYNHPPFRKSSIKVIANGHSHYQIDLANVDDLQLTELAPRSFA